MRSAFGRNVQDLRILVQISRKHAAEGDRVPPDVPSGFCATGPGLPADGIRDPLTAKRIHEIMIYDEY
jgi:hypothetical protein